MTIAVGILCQDGVVVGADREISLDTLKVRERKTHLIRRREVAVGIAGAGSADLVTLAVQELEKRLADAMSPDEVKG